MFEIPESVLVFVALVLALVAALFAAVRHIPAGTRTVVRRFLCPFRRTDVTVEFQEDPFGHGRYLDVTRCTVFGSRSAITCGKLCRYLTNFPARRDARGHEA